MTPHGGDDDDRGGFPSSWTVRGALWRIAASIVAPVVWLSLTLLYLGFWAHGLNLFQEIVIGVVSLLTLVGALILLWVSFGIRLYHRWVDG